MKSVAVRNVTNDSVVCSSARVANRFFSRLRGLLGTRALERGSGLLLTPSSAIHTFGMSIAIDVIALDRNLRVLGTWQRVRPWRIRVCSKRTHSVLELRSGSLSECRVTVGDQLAILYGEVA